MPTLAIISRKGGSGKSTVCFNLAVAAQDATLIDTDPQCSVADWADARGNRPPVVLTCPPSRLARTLKEVRTRFCFIDTQPTVDATLADALSNVDALLVVTTPWALDLRAIAATLSLVRMADRPAGIVLNKVNPRSNVTALQETLAETGLPVAPIALRFRAVHDEAGGTGTGVTELSETDPKAAAEVTALWNWVLKELLNGPSQNA